MEIQWNSQETRVYDVINSLDEFETLLRNGSDAQIYVSDIIELTEEHKAKAYANDIEILVVSGLPDVKVRSCNKVLNRSLT